MDYFSVVCGWVDIVMGKRLVDVVSVVMRFVVHSWVDVVMGVMVDCDWMMRLYMVGGHWMDNFMVNWSRMNHMGIMVDWCGMDYMSIMDSCVVWRYYMDIVG
jgi:hypothetical protein